MKDPTDIAIDEFLAGAPHAVVGASRDRHKYGNKVLRCYQQNGRLVYPVNPNAAEVEGLESFPDLASLPEPVHGISIITPPSVTEDIIKDAVSAQIRYVWMQPGAESRQALSEAAAAGLKVIADGPCILVVLGFRSGASKR